MQLLGIITFSQSVSEQQWDAVLANRTDLLACDAIEVVNPFTREVTVITSAKRLARIHVDGAEVGALRWCIDDSGIEIFGDEALAKTFVSKLAQEFGGKYKAIRR